MKALALVFLLFIPLTLSAQHFTPPSNQKCYNALGESKGIPKSIRPLFLNTLDIEPIPEPGPLDWLSSQYEPGQTFDQFQSGSFNIPDDEHPFLYLQPIGKEELLVSAIDVLSTYCNIFFNTQVKVLPSIEADPNQIRSRINQYTNEQQLHAGDILKTLDLNRPDDAFAVIAFTLSDLYPDESWNFVFGLANLRESVGVFSFARYGDPQSKLFMQRSLKIMSHEISHMYGMKHCIYYHCLMNGSNTLDETDRAPMNLCPVCLRKLHAATNPDHLMRYTKLKKVYENLELPKSADFARGRVELLLKRSLNLEN